MLRMITSVSIFIKVHLSGGGSIAMVQPARRWCCSVLVILLSHYNWEKGLPLALLFHYASLLVQGVQNPHTVPLSLRNGARDKIFKKMITSY